MDLLQGQEARGTPQRLAVRGDQLDGPHLFFGGEFGGCSEIAMTKNHEKSMKNPMKSHENLWNLWKIDEESLNPMKNEIGVDWDYDDYDCMWL